MASDITLGAAPQRRAGEGRYRELIERAADAMFVADSQGRVLEINGQATTLLGLSAAAVLGHHLAEFVAAEDLARQPLRLRPAAGQSALYERRVVRADGTELTIEVRLTALSDGCVVGFMRDLAPRQERLLELLEHARLEGALLAARTATHHVNNRLMVAIGFAEELADRSDLSDEARDLLAVVRSAAKDAAATLHRLEGIVAVRELEHAPGITTIDLDRSTAADD